MYVKFLQDWRGHSTGNIVECKSSAEIKGIQPQIKAGVCCEYDPEAPDEPKPKPKPKPKRKKKSEKTEEPAPKSAMTMGNMFGGDKT